MFSGVGHWEVILIFGIVLLVFGPKNLPRLARSMGSAIRDFKSGISGVGQELDEAMDKADALDDDPSAMQSGDSAPAATHDKVQ